MARYKTTYAIVGAGFAGVGLAYHLFRKGAREVLLLEQEGLPGQHASGRNAGMIRQVVFHEALARMVHRGAEFLSRLPAGWPSVSFRRCGSLLLAKGEKLKELEEGSRIASSLGVEVRWLSKEEVSRQIPLLKEGDFEKALSCPTDGVVDIQALLRGYLSLAQKAGLVFLPKAPLREAAPGGKGFLLRTPDDTVEAELLVNAGGAWAGELSSLCGASPIPLNPCRRHLFLSERLSHVSAEWPFVWDLSHHFYFRPEEGGLLLSPCDEDPVSPGPCPVEPSVQERLGRTLREHLPTLGGLNILRSQAGLRTLTRDGRFVIGFDPKLPSFFWLAGLGGHGVTASSSIGDLASDLLLGRPHDKELAASFSPERFVP